MTMKDNIILILFMYCTFVGIVGGISLYLEYDYAYINFWKRLRTKYNIIGCIIIYLITFPAILLILTCDLTFEIIIPFIIDCFEKIFKRRKDE